MSELASIRALCRMVKIEHSIFALPFAFMGAFAAKEGTPRLEDLLLIACAMVCVRSFAMTFNRIVDVKYDKLNPRTATRPLITGEISPLQAWMFAALMAISFVLCAAGMNTLCLALSPLALFLAAVYSYTKRFTWLCHFLLGVMLAMAPVGGWLAVTGEFALAPVLLAFGVVFWVAGFDIFYAFQDVEFDQRHALHSVPVAFGLPAALAIAGFCHVNAVIFFTLAGFAFEFSWPWFAAVAVVAGLLLWERSLVKPDDLSRLNFAFFILNGIISVMLFGGVLAAVYL